MAKNYQDIYNSVYVTGNKMDWTNAMIRGNGIPLDIYSVFDSYNDAVIFAATNAVAYEGQVLAVTENGDTTVYVITPALQGTIFIDEVETNIYLKEVGKATLGDNKSIVLSDDGILSLKNFGVEYYAYTETEKEVEGGEKEIVVEYVKTTGWKDGLTPKVVKVVDEEGKESFEIAWYEPSTTTVEGLSDKIATIETKVNEFDNTKANKATTIEGYGITDAYTKTEIDEIANGIDEAKADKATTLAGYGITDAYTKTEIDGKLSGLFHFKGEVNYYNELIALTDMVEGDVYVVKYTGTSGEVALGAEYVYDGEEWIEFGSLIDLSGYATKTELSDVNTKADNNKTDIDAINNETTGILANAKSYTDEKVGAHETATTNSIATAKSEAISEAVEDAKEYTDGREIEINKLITANTEAIEAINNGESGILADAKKYTDDREIEINKSIAANSEEITKLKQADSDNLDAAKKYADDLNSAMDTRVKANAEAIDAINNGENGVLKQSKDYTDSQINTHKTEAETAISTAKSEAITEAKGYTDEREVEINKGIDANTQAINAINNESTGILANAKAYADEKVGAHATATTNAIATAKGEAISEANSYTDGKVDTINGEIENLRQADVTTLADAKAYTDQKVVSEIAASNAMVYRGTVGVGGTVETLPTTEVKNGDTYKVFVAGTYNGVEATEGDMFIAVVTTGETTSIEWTYIPSGDDGNIYQGSKFESDSIVIAKANGTIETLGFGEAGQVLKSDGSDKTPVWTKETEYIVESNTDGLVVEKTVEEDKDVKYNVSLNSVSTDILTQGSMVLILNGGNASGVIASE